ncbi:uncharacterized protein LOC142538027 [Primulina tabacum]|uniref:uncharacterized protein LOC142538027 n=1 Tax=Primulina tabacum TaxID=48773 RepID=UPI003F596934
MDSRMEIKPAPLPLWVVVVALLLSQNLVIPVMSFEDQKNYYAPTPPTVSFTPQAHGSRGGHATPTPSHGGGSYGGTPPVNCGNPPGGGPLPTTPSPPTGGGTGGGYHNPPPTSIPTPTTPTTPTPPTGGAGGPSTSIPTPTTPTTPTPPTGGGTGGGYYNPPPTSIPGPTTPTTPTLPIGSPPTIPIIGPGGPTTPGITVPSPPFSFTPVSPPFTCIYWSTNPGLIWGLFGWIGTIGSTFGVTSLPGIGANMNLLQALSNTRSDGFGELYRQGTAALLNSAADSRFPYTTTQVRNSFVAALSSNKAAATQARLFKLANEGKTKKRA